jgi:hypothetical protein
VISPAPYPLVLSLAPRIVPLVLSLSKDEESADTLPLMVRQAHHERTYEAHHERTYEAHHERFLIASTTPLVLSLSKDARQECLR